MTECDSPVDCHGQPVQKLDDHNTLTNLATLELKGLQKFFKVILPAASPTILGGFVNALRNTFIMLVYAQMYGATSGMGYYVKLYSDFGLFNKVWILAGREKVKCRWKTDIMVITP